MRIVMRTHDAYAVMLAGEGGLGGQPPVRQPA